MSDLTTIVRIFEGSNGEATKMLYADLEKIGPIGQVALNLFRACKCSERAKAYRKGPGYKTEAYRRKDWSIENLSKVLLAGDVDVSWGWSIDEAMRERGDPHHFILYVDLPTGQVSFHNGTPYPGPDYAGQWDGSKGTAPDRICRFVAELFKASIA